MITRMKCPACGAALRWVDDAWICTRQSCASEWAADAFDEQQPALPTEQLSHPCGEHGPIFKGDEGPVVCHRPAGHAGDHCGKDYDAFLPEIHATVPLRYWAATVSCTEVKPS